MTLLSEIFHKSSWNSQTPPPYPSGVLNSLLLWPKTWHLDAMAPESARKLSLILHHAEPLLPGLCLTWGWQLCQVREGCSSFSQRIWNWPTWANHTVMAQMWGKTTCIIFCFLVWVKLSLWRLLIWILSHCTPPLPYCFSSFLSAFALPCLQSPVLWCCQLLPCLEVILQQHLSLIESMLSAKLCVLSFLHKIPQ